MTTPTLLDVRQSVSHANLQMITGTTDSTGDVIIQSVNQELAELYMYQNMTLEGGGTVSFNLVSSNYVLATTTNFALVINDSVSGTVWTKTISIGGSTYLNASGDFLYVTFTDWASNETLTAVSAATLPALVESSRFNVIFAKRSDNGGSPRVFLRGGQTIALGGSAPLGVSALATDSVQGTVTSYTPVVKSSVLAVSAASYTGTETDGYETITFATSSTNCTYTAPAVGVSAGRRIRVIKTDTGSGTVTVAAGGLLLGPGSGSPKVSSQGGLIEMECDGIDWYITNLQDTGTFVGTVAGGTTAPTATVRYMKTGDVVSIMMAAEVTFTKNTDSTGVFTMTGLPTAIKPTGTSWTAGYIEYNGGATTVALSIDPTNGFTWYKDLGQDAIANSSAIVLLGNYTFTYILNV